MLPNVGLNSTVVAFLLFWKFWFFGKKTLFKNKSRSRAEQWVRTVGEDSDYQVVMVSDCEKVAVEFFPFF